VSLHGCSQSQTYLGRTYVEDTGYLEWAGTNDIIVVFPQAKPVSATVNPTGCWDFFGFSGEGTDYLTKEGVQTSTIMKMVKRLQSTTDQIIIQ
jgi:poly(3-hydroxybutyrate) depolymerase